MSNQLAVRIEDADHSAQGHTLEAVLTFENMVIWGPKSCHNNIRRLENAIKMADGRFDFTFRGKDETIEGHTKAITVTINGEIVLDRISAHANMIDMVKQIERVQCDPTVQHDTARVFLDSRCAPSNWQPQREIAGDNYSSYSSGFQNWRSTNPPHGAGWSECRFCTPDEKC